MIADQISLVSAHNQRGRPPTLAKRVQVLRHKKRVVQKIWRRENEDRIHRWLEELEDARYRAMAPTVSNRIRLDLSSRQKMICAPLWGELLVEKELRRREEAREQRRRAFLKSCKQLAMVVLAICFCILLVGGLKSKPFHSY